MDPKRLRFYDTQRRTKQRKASKSSARTEYVSSFLRSYSTALIVSGDFPSLSCRCFHCLTPSFGPPVSTFDSSGAQVPQIISAKCHLFWWAGAKLVGKRNRPYFGSFEKKPNALV